MKANRSFSTIIGRVVICALVSGLTVGIDLAVENSWSIDNPTRLDPPTMICAIDIYPGHYPNGYNPRSFGAMDVALLGSSEFNVMDADFNSLRFGPYEAEPIHDLTDPITHLRHLRDVNFDGHVDLVMHYWNWATGIACGDTSASLIGNTLSCQPFSGSDSVWPMCVTPILERPPLLMKPGSPSFGSRGHTSVSTTK